MESSESVKPNPSQRDVLLNERNGAEDDTDEFCGYEDDEDDIDDKDFCFSVLKTQSNEVAGGINLKDLCDGKGVMFKFLKNDDEKDFFGEGEDADYNDDGEEIVNNIYKNDTGRLKEVKQKKPVLYLNESFESLVSRMTSITNDGCVKKEEISPGIGKIIPENSYVVVHYNLFKETADEPFDSTYLRNRPERINLGQNDLIIGLEIAIKSMRKKENSRFFIKWKYAFGALGCPDRIEPKCDIVADISVLNFKEIDVPGLVNDCGSWFERGVLKIKSEQMSASDKFKEGKIKQAITTYKRSVRMINNLGVSNDRDEWIFNELKLKSVVNLAICYNKLGQHEIACLMCKEALSISPRNMKALFHYARASIALSNFTRARGLLMTLNRMSPNNKDIINELRRLDKKKELYNMATQNFWKRAFMTVPETTDHKATDQGSNSPCSTSRGVEGTTRTNQESRSAGRPTEEEGISRRLEQNLKLKSEEDGESFLNLA